MKVMVTGSGGREHALAWRVAQSPLVDHVVVVPGNAGTALEPGMENLPLDVMDIDGQIAWARQNDVGLTIIGPEAPLVAGAVDRFIAAGLRCFGPSAAAAQLEGSKRFSKDFLRRHGIPTADYASFTSVDAALAYVRGMSTPVVVKADGLAAGKGVVVARTHGEAEEAIRDMLEGNRFGDAGSEVVVEEFLPGEEASFIVIADGSTFLPFATSQDHKPIGDGDTGPNTGGMGAYSPAPVVTPAVHQRVVERIIQPTIDGMAADGHAYTGFLYAGLMIDTEGNPRVIEFNCRFGDPETQPVMMRLQSDLVQLCLHAINGDLSGKSLTSSPDVALAVVMASGGYPGEYQKGARISGVDSVSGGKVFHAGTRLEGDRILTDGGRVLAVTALGSSVSEAQQRAYAMTEQIEYADKYCRSDIGFRAVARESQTV